MGRDLVRYLSNVDIGEFEVSVTIGVKSLGVAGVGGLNVGGGSFSYCGDVSSSNRLGNLGKGITACSVTTASSVIII